MATLPQRYFSTLSGPDSPSKNRILVPGQSRNDGIQFLNSVSSGTILGTGTTFSRDLARLRMEYNTQIGIMGAQIVTMRAEGKTPEEIATWAVSERTRIARSIRMRQNPGALVSLELRDNLQYGFGGRSMGNLSKRAATSESFARSGLTLPTYLTERAQQPNPAITEGALRAGTYLRYGGPILLVLGAGITAYNIESAAPQDRGKVTAEEAGSWTGSWILSGAAIAVMVALAPETGGLSLAGIGFVAGTAGGIGGSLLAHKIYYSSKSLIHTVKQTGNIPPYMIQHSMPH